MLSGLIDRYYIKQPRLRRAVTTLLEGDTPKRIALLGEEFTVSPVKEHGYLRASRLATRSSVFRDEVPILLSLASILPSADAFVDVGANVGLFSVTLSKFQHLYPLRFYAFEANPDTYKRLVENTRALGVEAFNIALSDREMTKVFLSGAVSHVFTSEDHKSAYSLDERVELPCRRLDSFDLAGDRLLLKIDVEGQELEVLRGASQWFEAGRVRGVYIDGYDENADVEHFLRSRGFGLLEARTLRPSDGRVHSLLALRGGAAPGHHAG